MKKIVRPALVLVALAFTSSPALAAWGLFDADRSYIGINVGGVTNNYTVWTNAVGNIQNAVFSGTPFTNASQTLQINYYDVKTFKNGGSDVTGGTFNWAVYETGNRPTNLSSFNTINIGFINNIGVNGDQKWGFSANTTSILAAPAVSFTSGLKNYTFEFYGAMNGTTPNTTVFDNNGGNNYVATFTTVPEPSTYALLAMSALGLAGYVARRRARQS